MSSTTKSAIISVLLPLLWSALHVTSWINPRFLLVLLSLERISELFDLMGIEFCPGLLPVLQASTPPSIDWFLSSKRDHDYGFNHICPWPLDSFTYDGACSHNALKEGFEGELDLTEEQLQQIADDIKAKNIAYGRAYHKQQRVDATPKFKAAQAKANKKHRPKTQQLRREARETKTSYCDVCHYAGGDAGKLKDHKETNRHKRRVQERPGI